MTPLDVRDESFVSQTLRRTLVALGATVLIACGHTVSSSDDAAPDGDANAADARASVDGAMPGDAAPDASVDVVAADVPFVTAMHTPLTQVTSRGGPTMSTVRLVVITYADDQNRAGIEGFGNWVGGSNWLHAVGADYGIGPGIVLPNGIVELTANAPDMITSTEIETMITTGVANGTLPSPADHDFTNVLYMVFFPSHTTISELQRGAPAGTSCQDFGGYHSEAASGTLRLAYAVVPDCPTGRAVDLSSEELAASHEYIEAATDPFPMSRPAYQVPLDGSTAWAFIGGEIGDLCELTRSAYTEAGFTVQRIWSNSAAAAGGDPCIPAPTTPPYFNVSVDVEVQTATGGDTVTFNLTGWSQAPVPSWTVAVQQQGGSIPLTPMLSRTTMNNGVTATVTFQVPAASTQGYASFLITSMESNPRAREVWPIAILVQ